MGNKWKVIFIYWGTQMSIAFTDARWNQVEENWRQWWAGELGRPIISLTCAGRDPGRPEPSLPYRGFHAFYDFSISADAIIDRLDYDLSCQNMYADAFPCVWPNFGPGVLAAFLGADLHSSLEADTVWFHPREEQELADVKMAFDRENQWVRRIADFYRAAQRRWGNSVQLSMTDLGGNLDVLSSFRPSEQLLFDLYDVPDVVKKRTWESHQYWWEAFKYFNDLLQPVNRGYTAWTPLFSAQPYYMLQCDFCYMISPEMFNEFVKPELAASCRKLTNAFYHLDGPGQLPHLDSLLSIPELTGVQWVPGDGSPDAGQWPEVYRKIRDAGKKIQIFTWGGGAQGYKLLDTLAEQLGSAEDIALIGSFQPDEEEDIKAMLKKYGAR